MCRKEDILAAIENLKHEKPDGWKRDARRLVRMLADLEDPFRDSVRCGDERTGRRSRPVRIKPI